MPDVKHTRAAKRILEASVKSLRYPSPLALEQKIDEYFDWCEKGVDRRVTKKGEEVIQTFRRPPTVSGLALWLGFGHTASLKTYLGHPDFAEVMQRGLLRIQCSLEEQAIVSRTPAGSIALLQMNFGHMTAADKAKIELKKQELEFRRAESEANVEVNLRKVSSLEAVNVARIEQANAARDKSDLHARILAEGAEFNQEIATERLNLSRTSSQQRLDLSREATERRLLLSEQRVNLQVNVNTSDGKVEVGAENKPEGLPMYPPQPKTMDEWLEWYEGVYGVKPVMEGDEKKKLPESSQTIDVEVVDEQKADDGEVQPPCDESLSLPSE